MTLPDQPTRYLQRALDVAREHAKLAGLRGTELRRQRADLTVALREESIEIAVSDCARELAQRQAGTGDAQAAAALARADTLDVADIDAEREARHSARDGATPMIAEPPAPFIELRERLAGARERGLPFAEAWTAALEDWESTPWRLAAGSCAAQWRAAYEGTGPTMMTALREQAADHGERADAAVVS